MIPAVVIVNYRTAQLTIDCLHSLAGELNVDRGDQVFVVDGCSPDDSATIIQQAIDTNGWTWATLIALDHNRGFAFANNSAIEQALSSAQPPDCFWLLNPDTVVQPGVLQRLLDFLRQHPRVGIAGGGVEDPSGRPEHASFRYPSFWSELDLHLRLGAVSLLLKQRIVAPPVRDDEHRTDWVNGANVMIRREVFEQIGLMDDAFFLYYEETDLCRRASTGGWEVWNVPNGKVTHLGGASTGILHDLSETKRRPAWWFNSRRRYFLKHYGYFYSVATDLVSILSLMSWQVRRVIQGKPRRDPPGYLLDLLRHSTLVPRFSK